MAILRFNALKKAFDREIKEPIKIDSKLSSMFGENVFDDIKMREYLTKEAYSGVKEAVDKGTRISRSLANQVASGMKDWALSKKVTHYTHWFQPLTGLSAEKHDAFFDTIGDGRAVESFSGSMLVQQEPDASSFPNGGIRNTFEARGYTAWDPTSPAFIMGTTLCIPTIFVSYTGEALDNKTPLLRALQSIDKHATKVAKYFDKNVKKVTVTLGWEQEYFLVDRALFDARPDLVITGRTLIGYKPAKGQQLDDHYFGAIPSRAMAFMMELEVECMKLGIPAKTRHNEVAPNQFELAPIFEEANLAVDHNTLIMDVMERIARKHDFGILFHEKPFAGINGSGKHNNWSLSTDTGINLLSPGKNPKKNLLFLTFFINTIKAVYEYGDLIRSSIATAGNDHRLGANEAPPAIISVFVGEHLTKVLNSLEKVSKGKLSPEEKTSLKLDVVGKIPELLLDNTDRNRTSPFAFTGNKFEIRAVGSSANCSQIMVVMNTIMAKQLKDFKIEVDALIKSGLKKDEAIFNILREYIKSFKTILFEGDGYGDDWVKEAEKRGLNNYRTTPEALAVETKPVFMDLFNEMEVMSNVELTARNEIKFEEYSKIIQIEANTLSDISRNHIIPVAISYQNIIIENVKNLKEIYGNDFTKVAKEQMLLIEKISQHIALVSNNVSELIELLRQAENIENPQKQATFYCNKIKPYFDEIRDNVDSLEMNIDDELWPIVKYRELLFVN